VIARSIFKKYDIRGKFGDTVTEAAAAQIGQSFGTYLQRQGQRDVILGHDNRMSSPALSEAAADGLARAGCSVIDIGMVATPVVYWCAVEAGDVGGMMITGSHLKPEMNGFKLSIGKRSLYGDQIEAIYTMIQSGDLSVGEGHVLADDTVNERYLAMIENRLPKGRALKIVVDAGNGMGGIYGPPLLEAFGHNVICLYCKPDGTYPNHQPDPQEEENLHELKALVLSVQADLGLAFDGDSDRVGVVDNEGHLVTADRVLVLLARDILSRNPGATVVADVLSTQVLFDEVRKAGGNPIIWKSGHSLVKAKMAETGALLGGEMSGHIFVGDGYYGYDDGIYVAGRITQMLAAQDHPLSEIMNTVPMLASTPEYRPHCPDEEKERVIESVQQALSQYDMNTVDGIRILFDHGWGLLRASGTEPVLSLRFEGETEAHALAYKELVRNALKQAYPAIEDF
jgi:phosphomannomutase/phosphoglucomutase